MTSQIRVLVADDHPAVLSGLVALLGAAAEIEVVAEATDGASAVRLTAEHRPDVVLTDVRMPGATGIEITPRLREYGARVLVISAFDLDEFVLGALAAGADGYLTKSEDPGRILQAVRAVARGEAMLSPTATRAVVAALREFTAEFSGDVSGGVNSELVTGSSAGPTAGTAIDDRRPVPPFTRREEEVLALVAHGLSNQQIAQELFVEVTTVKSHLSHALAKLQLDSRLQAALWWQQHH
ncbi:response regulator [Citricoccus sp. GCM10030269]|uniref:response regulator n=1 Tax=Citricoccus sp. GCM10030269 TaxID=3273388 RepID=UPI003618FA51